MSNRTRLEHDEDSVNSSLTSFYVQDLNYDSDHSIKIIIMMESRIDSSKSLLLKISYII